MTTQILRRAQAAAAGAERGAVATLLARLAAAWHDWCRYRRTLGELRGLSDRELEDIGLTREALADIARDAGGAPR